MAITLNPFTGQFDFTGSGSGSSPSIGGPITGGTDQSVLFVHPGGAIAQDNPDFTYDQATNKLTVAGSLVTPSVVTNSVDRATAGTLAIGTSANSTIINIGNAGATVNIQGTTLYENVTVLNVSNPNINLNVGGGAGSGSHSGINIQEATIVTGYNQTSADRNSWELKAPNTVGIVTITPGAVGFTIDQGSHNPVTIGTANGLSLVGQALSMALANGTVTGTLSAADYTTFNNKANSNLGNLTSPTAVNQDLLPAVTGASLLGSNTKKWFQVWGTSLIASAGQVLLKNSAGTNQLALDQTTGLPSGASEPFTIYTTALDGLGIYTGNDSAVNGAATGDLRIETGNKTAGTGNSGNIALQTGTSSGGTRGSITLNGSSINASSTQIHNVVDPTSAQDAATKNYVDSAGGSFANKTLSNLTSPTAINQNLLPATDGGEDLGTNAFQWGTVYVRSSISFFGGTSFIERGVTTPSGLTVDAYHTNNATTNLGVFTATTTASKQINIETGNGTAGASGNITLQTGTATTTRGSIILNGLNVNVSTSKIINVVDPTAAQDAATKNYVDTQIVSGAGANKTLSNLNSPTAINQNLIADVTTTRDLGSSTIAWNRLWVSNIRDSGDNAAIGVDNRSLVSTSGTSIARWNNANIFGAGSDGVTTLGSAANRWLSVHSLSDVLYGSTSGTITVAAANTTTSYSIKWPSAQGAANTFPQNDGSGNLSWVAGNAGTVTSVALSVPSFLSVAGSPVTTSGTLAITLATQIANTVFAGPASGGALAPTFRALVAADIPFAPAASAGDLNETSFSAAAAQTNQPVTAFAFANATVRSFRALVSVSTSATNFAQFQLDGIQKSASWEMSSESVGDSTGYSFSINSSGQVLYTSGAATATIKFRAITTTV